MRVLGYVGNKCTITKRDAEILTNINVAFGGLDSEGTIHVDNLDIFDKMDEIRGYNPEIKIVVSIVNKNGHPTAFTKCAASEELRQNVANSCLEMVTKYRLDGVDFDWEFPCVPSNGVDASPEDRDNFTQLCKVVRKTINQATLPDGSKPLVTIAAGADLYYVHGVDLPAVNEYLDYICLMTYDLKCGFHALAGHHTQLYSSSGDVFRNSCEQALELFHNAGIPKEKLLMGAAFYSRKWENIENRNHGLLQISKTGGGYGPDYDKLVEEYIDKNGFVRYWDDEAKAPWLFDGSTFLSYDDELSIEHKCNYVIENQYGGIFYWEHKCDKTSALINVMGKVFKR